MAARRAAALYTGDHQDDVFISETDSDEGLLMLSANSNENTAAQLHAEQETRESDDDALLFVESADGADDSVAVVVEEPRRAGSDPKPHFQPSQIEEKLLNHRLLAVEDGGDVEDGDDAAAAKGSQDAGRSPRRRRASIWNGMVSCLAPVMGYFKKEKQPKPQQDEWEIDFADISELDFIGSGAQGAVFAGSYLGQQVAVKKVKDPKYCDEAFNMRKLNHPNIVKLM